MANKLLGQHFLVNRSKLRHLVKSLDISPDDFIIEVGPGRGVLTDAILDAEPSPHLRLVAVEKDRRLAAYLASKYASDQRVTIITGDILTSFPSLLDSLLAEHRLSYKVVGNIPYYLTGRLIRLISEARLLPSQVVFMVQREVGERLVSVAGFTKLSAAVSRWSKASLITTLSPSDFCPAPQVSSAIISLTKLPDSLIYPLKSYEPVISAAFSQPRKTLVNNLTAAGFPKASVLKIIHHLGLSDLSRPSDLNRDLIFQIGRALF